MDERKKLRSDLWFNEEDPGEAAVYLERYGNYGITREELQSGRPMIGIAQSGSDLVPCNRIHNTLVERVKAGIRDAGGLPFEFPSYPIQETGKRPTAALDRNLAYLSLVEILAGYFFDGVVLTTGCDKTTPAALMAAATVNLPAIILSGGPMLDGYVNGKLAGTGLILWESRRQLAEGEITGEQLIDRVLEGAPSLGHCNSMGTALSMNSLAEALGMSLPGCAAIPRRMPNEAGWPTSPGAESWRWCGRISPHPRCLPGKPLRIRSLSILPLAALPIAHRTSLPSRGIWVLIWTFATGNASATRSTCWPMCSPRENISVRPTTAPAAWARFSAS